MVDEPRLLHRRSELGYTNRSVEAANGEPEAVSEDEQARITASAHRREAGDRHEQWLRIRRELEEHLDELRSTFGSLVANELRALRRELDRLDVRLR